ncbi:MAG: 4Fe-4S dicluster domain-containing protein [bacterium]
MKNQSRRDFFKTTGLLTAGLVGLSSESKAGSEMALSKDRMGVLVDTTVCIGCRKCEWACKNAHQLPAGDISDYENRAVFEKRRRPDHTALTVVNEYPNPEKPQLPINVKVQCMHCDRPACVSACIVGAFSKMENGSVVWDTDKCIGCRYCMVACPFQVPAFDYDKALKPDISKCDFCFDRTKQGLLPACVQICPVEALTYGKRSDLIQIAYKRIENYPDRYINHLFGETEVGGTSWMYMANKDFAKLDFPKLGESPAPGVSESIQHGIFAYFVPPLAFYALIGGIMWLTKKKDNSGEEN